MRVLHVINSLSGSGGAEQGMAREVLRLRDDFDQVVVTLYPGGHLLGSIESAGIPVSSLGLNPSRSGWNWPTGVIRLRRMIKRLEPDVVHSSLFSANLVSQLATRGSGVPILTTFTLSGDLDLMRAYQPGADTYGAALLRRISRFAASGKNVRFRALTRDAQETNSHALGVDPARSVVIPRGVAVPDWSRARVPRDQLGLPNDVPLVLNVGRQSAQKGHTLLIEAFAGVVRERPAHLVIIGRDGDATDQLRQKMGALRLTDEVTVIPYTDRVDAYYREARVFAFSSMMEGLGTAVLEAMASRTPVVAFDIPPVREVTDDGRVAELVPLGDTAALEASISRFLDGGEATERLVDEAFIWVSQNFSIDGVVGRLRRRLLELATGDSLDTD
jgi:glycosyltransferase involved in cell wall biosynthesis